MSESEPSKVFMFDGGDPAMQQASEKARAAFRYFWREIAWERRRIVPGLDMACVKAPFSDGDPSTAPKGAPNVEHMWMSEIDFDGRVVRGVLLNSPNWLKTVKEGDSAEFPLSQIGDWMYAIRNEVFGAYTVNLMRSRMGPKELRGHDQAWGLNFGDPGKIRNYPDPQKTGGLLKNLFGKPSGGEDEHPMSENMAPKLKEQLARDPSMISSKDDGGWTLLHHQALAGSLATVKVLLEAGADRHAVTNHGMTARQLAESLGWDRVVALLQAS